MDFKWNIPDEVLMPTPPAPTPTDAEIAARVSFGRGTDSQESPPTDSQESLPKNGATPQSEYVDRVYELQATHGDDIDKLSRAIVELLAKAGQRVSPDVRACAIGRALVVMGDPNLVFASYDVEQTAFPQKGDRVVEDNGATGTVITLISLTQAVVKWDHMPRAICSDLVYLKILPPEKG